MAQAPSETPVAAAGLYPLPPPYFTAFTDANLARYEQLRITGSASTSHRGDRAIKVEQQLDDSNPAELVEFQDRLEPPSPSVVNRDARWATFGQMHIVSWTLADRVRLLTAPIAICKSRHCC